MIRQLQCFGAAVAAVGLIAAPALAQQIEGDATGLTRSGRILEAPGTFWLDSNDDVEVIRYTTPRDVRLCLPRPEGPDAAKLAHPLQVTWDQSNRVVLRPGNCLFFDARRVTVKPATDLPRGVTLRGHVETERALQG